MNFLHSFLFCYLSISPSVLPLQISSKLDFNTRGTREKVKNLSTPLRVIKQESDESVKQLSVVCSSTINCKQNDKKAAIVRNVQIVIDNDSEEGRNKVDVPDVPVVVGTKGMEWRNPDFSSRISSEPANKQIKQKIYFPLFGSSVIEGPMPSLRNYRSTTVGNNYYAIPQYVRNKKVDVHNLERVVICECKEEQNGGKIPVPIIRNPLYRKSTPMTWNIFASPNSRRQIRKEFPKRPGIDDKILPLD